MSRKELSAGLDAFCKAYDADSPESAMRVACASLLASVGFPEPPIALKPLLQELGIELRRVGRRKAADNSPEALLAASKGGLVAFVHEGYRGRDWRRARFSLAHELGHALLIKTLRNTSLVASLEETPEFHRQVEGLCDFAASEILMPAQAVRRAIRAYDFTPEGLTKLYDKFLVSREVLVRRLAVIIPHASVVKWRVYARSGNEPKQMRVVGSFPGYSRIGSRPWLPSGCTTRHIDPPIVDWAATRREPVLESDLQIRLRGKLQECVGLATFFPLSRTREQQPSFEGFAVPDERSMKRDIFLFVADKAMAGDGVAKEFKKE